MGIIIRKIIGRDNDFSIAELRHGTEVFTAKVLDKDNCLEKHLLPTSPFEKREKVIVELDYEKVIKAKRIADFDNKDSIITAQEDLYLIKGQISNLTKTEKDTIVDLYIQKGPEFLSILKSELGELPLTISKGLEIIVSDLRFYPTHT